MSKRIKSCYTIPSNKELSAISTEFVAHARAVLRRRCKTNARGAHGEENARWPRGKRDALGSHYSAMNRAEPLRGTTLNNSLQSGESKERARAQHTRQFSQRSSRLISRSHFVSFGELVLARTRPSKHRNRPLPRESLPTRFAGLRSETLGREWRLIDQSGQLKISLSGLVN